MVVSQGDVGWADLPDSLGAEPGYLLRVIVVQGAPMNRSRISTVVCVVVTRGLKWVKAPGMSGSPPESQAYREMPWSTRRRS